MRLEALQQVRQLPAIAKVEQELLDGSTRVDFGDHASIDTVKHPGHPNEQSWLHLTCTDEHVKLVLLLDNDSAEAWL